MLYELRQHDARSARGLDALTQEFDSVVLPAWERHAIESVGFWSVLVGPTAPRLTALLAWEDLGRRERLWDAFSEDPEWRRAQAERAEDPARSVSSTILRPLPGSHLARHGNQPQRLAGGIFELRTLAFDQGATLDGAARWFLDGGLARMEHHGMFVMGVWETYLGVMPQLSVMLVFESLAHRERAWAAFLTDPFQAGTPPDDLPLLGRTESSLMKGTEFSHWR